MSRNVATLSMWVSLAFGVGVLTGCLDNTVATESAATIEPNRFEVIESFQTNCHDVQIYRLSGELRMEVLPRSKECQVVPGSDLPARSQENEQSTVYFWEEDGVRVQAVVPAGGGTSTLEFIGDSVEPNGRKVELEESDTPTDPDTGEATYREGYNQGFQTGARQGRSDRVQNLGYNPSAVFADLEPTGTPSYEQGFEDGFFAGYETGYYVLDDISVPPPPVPPVASVSLVCRGVVGNSDFSVFYSPGVGFSRIEIRPRTSPNLLTAQLSYIGNNQDGQQIWRGAIAGMADVTVVHLATGSPQAGDRVLVSYDGQRATGFCQRQETGGINGMW